MTSLEAIRRSPRVLLSFGIGRLHFTQAAEVLVHHGVNIEAAQGIVLGRRTLWVLSKLATRAPTLKRVVYGLNKRNMDAVSHSNNHAHPFAEISQELLLRLARGGIGTSDHARVVSWRRFGKSTARLLRDHDAVHVRAGAGYGILREANRRGIPTIVDFSIAHPAFLKRVLGPEYELSGKPLPVEPEHGFWRMCVSDAEQARIILVNSNFVKETLIAEGIDPEKVFVSYLGVRSDFLGLKTDYRCDGELTLLFTGSFGLRKGAQYLVPAFERIIDAGVNAKLVILGSIQDAREIINNSSVSHRIFTPGFIPQDELKHYLATSDIYVFPSLAEGCASSGMEALAAGLPVVATKESGLPIEANKTGVIVERASSQGIVDAILKLAYDENIRRYLGENAARDMAQKYSWDDYGRRVSSLYKDLIRTSRQVTGIR